MWLGAARPGVKYVRKISFEVVYRARQDLHSNDPLTDPYWEEALYLARFSDSLAGVSDALTCGVNKGSPNSLEQK